MIVGKRRILVHCGDCYYEVLLRGNVIESVTYFPNLKSSRHYRREWSEVPEDHKSMIIVAME